MRGVDGGGNGDASTGAIPDALAIVCWLCWSWCAPAAAAHDPAGPAPTPVAPSCSTTVTVLQEDGTRLPAEFRARLSTDAGLLREVGIGEGTPPARIEGIPCTHVQLEIGRYGRGLGGGFSVWDARARAFAPGEDPVWTVHVAAVRAVDVLAVDPQGRPSAGAVVSTWGIDPPMGRGGKYSDLTTGDDGRGRMYLRDGVHDLRVSASVGRTLSIEIDGREAAGARPVFEVRGAPVAVRIVLPAGIELRGVVRDEDGDPIEGVSVSLTDGDWFSRRSSVRGTFVVVAPRLPITVSVGHLHESWEFDPPHVRVEEVPERPLEFVGRKGDGPSLEGTVVEEGTSDPIAGARVTASAEGCAGDLAATLVAAGWRQAEADGAGRFRVACRPGCALRLDVRRPGVDHGERFDVDAAACEGEHVFALERGASLEVLVKDRRGLPLEGLPLATRQGSARTDAEGRVRFDHVRPGTVWLEVDRRRAGEEHARLVLVPRRGAERAGRRVHVEIERDEDSTEAELRAVPHARACVDVVSEGGDPGALGSLLLYAPDGEEPIERIFGRADRSHPGRLCTREVAPGEYLVKVAGSFEPLWLPGVLDREVAVPQTLDPGVETVLGPVVVGPPTGTLTITLRGRSLGDRETPPRFERIPAVDHRAEESGAVVDWRPHREEWVHPVDRADACEEEEDDCAVFRLTSFPVGRWRLRACPDRESPCSESNPAVELKQSISIEPGKNHDVGVESWPETLGAPRDAPTSARRPRKSRTKT